MPKTSDISSLNTVFLSRSHLSPAAYQRLSALHVPEVDWWMAGGTTAAFVALMLALAAWLFHRRDW